MRHLAFCLAILPTSAPALDCLQASVGQSARALTNGGTPHLVIRGRLHYAPSRQFPLQIVDGGIDAQLAARITGRAVLQDGYGPERQVALTQKHFCHEPWCDSIPDGAAIEDAFFVLRDTRRGYVLETGMCEINIHPTDEATEADLFACLRGEPSCTPPEW